MIIMVYIETDKDNKVIYQHFFPEQLSDEQKVNGYLIDSVPEPTIPDGKFPTLYYTTQDGFTYVYEDLPLEDNDRIEKLLDIITANEAEKTLKDQKIAELEQRVSALEGGN